MDMLFVVIMLAMVAVVAHLIQPVQTLIPIRVKRNNIDKYPQ